MEAIFMGAITWAIIRRLLIDSGGSSKLILCLKSM